MLETKRDRFVRVAETRTNKIITLMNLLGNCSNKNNYEYTDKDVEKIFLTLENELVLLKEKFEKEPKKKGKRFSLE
ncbi:MULTISPECIES: hypothetical protein [unclassified Peribacillus]|uniref:hypothetical protein n=1 Tax=unclassified Peribacillus TaxID=2675266 RepID=UPI0038033561